jgi:hypothetical protein
VVAFVGLTHVHAGLDAARAAPIVRPVEPAGWAAPVARPMRVSWVSLPMAAGVLAMALLALAGAGMLLLR